MQTTTYRLKFTNSYVERGAAREIIRVVEQYLQPTRSHRNWAKKELLNGLSHWVSSERKIVCIRSAEISCWTTL